jgi:outer membrane biosynthesis protein TonB
VVPTLAVIILAYIIAALINIWPRRKKELWGSRSRGWRGGWLALAGAGAGLGFILLLALTSKSSHQNLRIAGFLGTGWAEGQPEKAGPRQEYPQMKPQGPGEQPVYALLHPETPGGQLGPDKKTPAARSLKKPKVQKLPTPQAKSAKSGAVAPKKERVATSKTKPKKKKQSSSPASPKATGG